VENLRPFDGPLYLERRNAHHLDKLLTFNEDYHQYTFDNKTLSNSVTKVVGNYFEKFVPEKAVTLMMDGKNWPRPQYSNEDGSPFTREKILQQWEDVGLLARNQGTLMHSHIELHLNDLDVPTLIPEFSQFLDFKRDVMEKKGVRPYRTEWRVAAPELNLGGSVDFVGTKEDGSFVLMDWKRSKNLVNGMFKNYGKMCR
jgi:hypothetical protein